METETKVIYAHGDEEETLAWDLAGERYNPVRFRGIGQDTTWDLPEILAHAEGNGLVITPLLVKELEAGPPYVMVADLDYGDHHGLCLFRGALSAWLFADNDPALDALAKVLTEGLPERPEPPKLRNAINVAFSYDIPGSGNHTITRQIAAPTWEEIAGNYTAEKRAELEKFILGGPEDCRGHLGILHGTPGSGKTTFIRALAREWQGKARISYIIDTETLFNNPGYLLNIILDGGRDNKWHLIVCEDAENFLVRSAKEKEQVGQAISRILNVGDGMLGQGLRVLLLFTTNVKKTELDDAIIRKGRCFLDVELPAFKHGEALHWLVSHGMGRTEALAALLDKGGKVRKLISLAELYDISGIPPEITLEQEDDQQGDNIMEDWEFSLGID